MTNVYNEILVALIQVAPLDSGDKARYIGMLGNVSVETTAELNPTQSVPEFNPASVTVTGGTAQSSGFASPAEISPTDHIPISTSTTVQAVAVEAAPPEPVAVPAGPVVVAVEPGLPAPTADPVVIPPDAVVTPADMGGAVIGDQTVTPAVVSPADVVVASDLAPEVTSGTYALDTDPATARPTMEQLREWAKEEGFILEPVRPLPITQAE